jgi:D-amino peptidase
MVAHIGTQVRTTSGDRGIVVPCVDNLARSVSIHLLGKDHWPTSILTVHEDAFSRDWFIDPPKATLGRVVILADMEGISGVPNSDEAVTPAEETGGTRTAIYSRSCSAMTRDVQMVIAGVRAAGAAEIIVADTHWHDTNLSDEDFDVPVVRGSQAAINAMYGADAVMMIGWHAKAGTANACLPHTYTSRIARLAIDGSEVGEIGMLAKLASSQGAAVLMVSGDLAAAIEANRDVGSCQTVATKMVNAKGAMVYADQREAWRNLLGKAFGAIRGAALCEKRGSLLRHEPGVFEVQVHPGYEVDGDHEAVRVGTAAYRIAGATIKDSYAAFQRLIDRLPPVTSVACAG